MDAALTDAFEANRPRLKRLAYRMLGSVAEAEDAVQDAWLRWTRAGEGVTDPAAWLVRATTRLCIDRLREAKAEREAYRGPWLPEPLIEPLTEDPVERAEDVSVAFLLALERLSPLERAVFLLHDVFDAGLRRRRRDAGPLRGGRAPARQPRPRARPRRPPALHGRARPRPSGWPPPSSRPPPRRRRRALRRCWPKTPSWSATAAASARRRCASWSAATTSSGCSQGLNWRHGVPGFRALRGRCASTAIRAWC